MNGSDELNQLPSEEHRDRHMWADWLVWMSSRKEDNSAPFTTWHDRKTSIVAIFPLPLPAPDLSKFVT